MTQDRNNMTSIGGQERLSERNFKALAQIIESQVGIKLAPTKLKMIEGRLRKRVLALGLSGFSEYVARALDPEPGNDELIHLFDCVTTNKTDFFREPEHFTFLQREAIPALVTEQARNPARIKIWSAASSTGAEAYTIAMVLQDLCAERQDFQFSILGTDICTEVLREAKAAIYPRDMLSPVPADKQFRYVMRPRNPSSTKVRIIPELRRTVRFERLNLMNDYYPFDTDVDVIFCRNVLIYFDSINQKAVIDRLASHLRPGGYLLVGHSESMAGTGAIGLRQVRPTIFQAKPRAAGMHFS